MFINEEHYNLCLKNHLCLHSKIYYNFLYVAGQKYAMAELKSIISLVIRKFRLLPSKVPITPSFNVVLKSSTGVHLFIEHRKKSLDESGACC